MTRPSEYVDTKDGITIMVWMSGYGRWEYYARRGGQYKTGTVEADNRVEAWNIAYDAAKMAMMNDTVEREG